MTPPTLRTDDSVILNKTRPLLVTKLGQDTSQSEFYYAPPTGFKSLNTSNLDAPTVTPEENFNIALYNGNSSSNPKPD